MIDRQTESKLWKEFNHHFSQKDRPRGEKVNHHDFLDLPNITNISGIGRFSMGRIGKHDSSFINSEGGFNLDHQPGPADVLFSGPNERMLNKLRVFNSMKMNSIQMPLNAKVE